jgi:hypothetical protein
MSQRTSHLHGIPWGVDGDTALWRDLIFVADLSRRMQASTYDRCGRGRAGAENQTRERIASGSLDAALWLLSITDLPPVSEWIDVDRSLTAVAERRAATADLRRQARDNSPEWLYLGGVADVLDFALGLEESYWWAPLPESMRAGPPRRNAYGREIR